jgi:diguanylate cyclase (GGDEF)-like protein
MRQGDLAARLGGEEFVALLSHCEPEDGWRFAERLRECIADQAIAVDGGGSTLSLTVSIGLAAPAADGGSTLDILMAQADGAMYQAKQAGRNRTQLAA